MVERSTVDRYGEHRPAEPYLEMRSARTNKAIGMIPRATRPTRYQGLLLGTLRSSKDGGGGEAARSDRSFSSTRNSV